MLSHIYLMSIYVSMYWGGGGVIYLGVMGVGGGVQWLKQVTWKVGDCWFFRGSGILLFSFNQD